MGYTATKSPAPSMGLLPCVLAWTSDGSGNATVTTPALYGIIRKVSFVPGTGGNQPTNLYDITLTDDNSIDVLSGQGANLANNANTSVCPGCPLKDGTTTSTTPMAVASALTLNVTNAGATKTGTVVIYLEQM